VKAAVVKMQLESVPHAGWRALKEDTALSLNLNVEIDHIGTNELTSLSKALERVRGSANNDQTDQFWEWLSLPADSTEDGKKSRCKALPRIRALLALLGQLCGNSADLAGAAGTAYLALLALDGADKQWSTIFQPGIFRMVFRTLKVLRRGDLKPKKDKAEAGESATGDGEEIAPPVKEGKSGEGDGSEDAGLVPVKDAMDLLGKVVSFLDSCNLCASGEAITLATEELAQLILRPLDDSVGKGAVAGLSALVSKAGGTDEVRKAATAAVRATMPGVLMTQDRLQNHVGSIPKQLQHSRTLSLKFLSGLIQNLPDLLTPETYQAPVEEEVEEEEVPKKRRRKAVADGAHDADIEEDDDKEGQDVDEDGKDADAKPVGEGEEGEKKIRRRRPRGVPTMNDPIVAFLELICVLTPDRSEWRGYSCDTVLMLLCEASTVERKLELEKSIGAPQEATAPSLPIDESGAGDGVLVAVPTSEQIANDHESPTLGTSERFLLFLERLLQSERVSCRTLATEIAVSALERNGQLGKGTSEAARAALVKKLLVALVQRCSDFVPTVRGRALGGVATGLQFLSKSAEGTALLRELLTSENQAQRVDLAGLFRAGCLDEKPTARKAALHFFDAMIPIIRTTLSLNICDLAHYFDTSLIASLSADESLLVRKSSIASIANLLRHCPLPVVCELWVRNVLPLVLDVEASVTERALDELEAAVFTPLIEHADLCARGKGGDSPMDGLPAVLDKLDSEAVEYLQRGLQCLAKRNDGKVPKKFVKALGQMVSECLRPLPLMEWPVAVWSMLEEVTAIDKSLMQVDQIVEAWLLYSAPAMDVDGKPARGLGGLSGVAPGKDQTSQQPEVLGTKILRVLENVTPGLSKEQLDTLMESMCTPLSSLSAPTPLIRGMMTVVSTIDETWKGKGWYKAKAAERLAWKKKFLSLIQATLGEFVRADVGEVCIDARRVCACLFNLGELALQDGSLISDGVITTVQTVATNTIWRDGLRVNTDSTTRGHAFSTLGKFCLRKDALAKRSVEMLVMHLTPKESFVVRNNVLIVLGDICNHYTGLVDRFIPHMTDVLRDTNELLRKQASMIIASLLSEDFIKLRGSIMLRFLYVLSDPSHSVRNFVECVFARILHQRNPAIFSQNFLDVLCGLSGFLGLQNFQGAAGNEEFSLQKSPSRRAMIYRFMLSMMTSEQKFNICAQIVTTLLAAFVDSEEKMELPTTIDEPGGQALSDGLSLLCCKEMRICFTTQKAGGDEDAPEGDKASADAARGVLSSILKRNMCENIVPVIVQLKNLMESKRSPFLKHVRHCLREILRDFKDDLEVMLAGDVQLAKEIAHDFQASGETEEARDAPAVPLSKNAALSGASRRVSLSSMMRTPGGPKTPWMGSTAQKNLEGSPQCPGTTGSSMPKARRLNHSDSSYRSPERAALPLTSPAPPLGDADLESPREPRLPVAASSQKRDAVDLDTVADGMVEKTLRQAERLESDEPAAKKRRGRPAKAKSAETNELAPTALTTSGGA